MDYESYRRQNFVDPQPEPRFDYLGLHGVTLFFADYEAALDYYSRVLGPPAYVEGKGTRGWRIGDSWLTLLQWEEGAPKNVEFNIVMKTSHEAEQLQAAFIEAGGKGEPASDQLMYEPVRFCPLVDPFGTNILIFSHLPG
jgi:catechol 2,3-dioxygenase-like lactoylglutathione lyase family enzyme